jgi:pyridoxine/pyridoxamine 5'-phosphate oxidase
MTRAELYAYLREQPLGVVATASPDGTPEAAVVGIVVSESLEVFFDTLASSRKARNLGRNPRAAFVIGWGDRTVQLDGVVDTPTGDELMRLQALYFARYPDGGDRLANWPGLTYFRLRPHWARHSDYRDGEKISELDLTR